MTTSDSQFASSTEIRHVFSMALSQMYQQEVPLYADLLALVKSVNETFLDKNPSVRHQMQITNQLERLHYERHGAIRLGTAEELALMARFFAVMGMQPVGYYDLSLPPAKLPIYATCFRCLDLESLSLNPFRVFVSLLRPELISDNLRSKAFDILSRRTLFTEQALDLISTVEKQGGLHKTQVDAFIEEGLKPFKWSARATVSLEEYKQLQVENPLLADIVAFPTAHINHLTPRTLDIDAVQKGMEEHYIPMKELIEGPPARKCAILLRQTSFKALEEKVYFPEPSQETGAGVKFVLGSHTARFGEIEQRGAALTEKGRLLYDSLLKRAWTEGITAADPEVYAGVFKSFPDDWETIRSQDLAFFRYYVVDNESKSEGMSMEELIQEGKVAYEPLVYEDFLPLSAAGIFQSNLRRNSDTKAGVAGTDKTGKTALEKAIGKGIMNEFMTYRAVQEESLISCRKHFGIVE